MPNSTKCLLPMLQLHLSEDIESLRGLHQGAPLSMFLFNIFIDELLQLLQEFSPGVKFLGLRLNAMAYTDDITILATCKNDLQALFDIAYEYSRKWKFQFNPQKCVTLSFGKLNRYEKLTKIKMGPHLIKTSTCENYLGIPLASDNESLRRIVCAMPPRVWVQNHAP